MAISKIILNGVTQMDLTGDTVEASNLLQNYTAHKNDGTQVTGTATSGNVFLITLTQNQNDEFIPNCTFAEYLSAYQANKIISAQMADATTNGSIVDITEMSAAGFTCSIQTFWINNEGEPDQETIVVNWNFVMNLQGYSTTTVMGYYDITNATAVASDVAQGKYFYGSQGIDIGTSSGGSSKNVQVAQSTNRASSSTYTSLVSLTCSTAGKYDIYWDCFRSSTGGTNGSQLYINEVAQGTANTTFTNHAQTNHLTNVTLAKDDVVAVYARSRGSSYFAYVGTLTIVQTA